MRAYKGDTAGITRRGVLKAGAGLAVAATVGSPALVSAAPKSITVANGGGALEAAFRPAYFDTFEKETGIKVISAPYLDGARLKAMVDAKSVDIDVTDIDSAEAGPAAEIGLLEEIDYSIVPKEGLQNGAVNRNWTNIYIAGAVLAWNTDAAKKTTIPKNWKEFFDPKLRGQRSLFKSASQTLDIVAMGAGQDKAKLYPLDIDAAFKVLEGIRGELSWFDSGAQGAQLISSNEVDFGMIFNGRIQPLKAQGAPVDYTFENCLLTFGSLSVPKGVRDREVSMRFIAHCLKAKNQAIFANNIAYGPTNNAAFAELSAERLREIPNSPENIGKGVFIDIDYWTKNGRAIFDRFNNWLMK
jgi:putative spermidine/putrescine transport system substrate-binding protein